MLTEQNFYLLFPSPEGDPVPVPVLLQFCPRLHAGSPCWPRAGRAGHSWLP